MAIVIKLKKFMNIEDNNVIGIKAGYDYQQLDDKVLLKKVKLLMINLLLLVWEQIIHYSSEFM